MVVTVTLNPALDITARAEPLRPGQTNRLAGSVVNAGGKGVNAARMVKTLGGRVTAAGFAGAGFTGLLGDLEHRFYPVDGLRVNMKVLDPGGGMTELNGQGVPAGAEGYRWLEESVLRAAAPGTVAVLSGSLPPGAEPGLYAKYIGMLKEGGCTVILDASGEALRLGALAGPDLIKPNRDEIGFIDRSVYTGILVHSLGAEGARFYFEGRERFVPALDIQNASPAGAGDCMVGALAYALDAGLPFEEAALLSAACAAAAVMTPGTGCPSLELVRHCRAQTFFLTGM